MAFEIYLDGVLINTIHASEDFAKEYCEANGYTYQERKPYLSPAERRERAYNAEKTISWNGKPLTVTEAATLWVYYAAEGNEKAAKLQALIAVAKAEIREKNPTEE